MKPTTKTPVTLTKDAIKNKSRKTFNYESSYLMVWILALETRPSSVGPDDSLSLGEDLPVVVNVMFSTWYIMLYLDLLKWIYLEERILDSSETGVSPVLIFFKLQIYVS